MRLLKIIEEQPIKEEAPVEIEDTRMVGARQIGNRIKSDAQILLCSVREDGELKDNAVWLNGVYDWEFGVDSQGVVCAVPLEKK